jgi:hypothetical protein
VSLFVSLVLIQPFISHKGEDNIQVVLDPDPPMIFLSRKKKEKKKKKRKKEGREKERRKKRTSNACLWSYLGFLTWR